MGLSRWDYADYLRGDVCLKSDLTPKGLSRYGIKATQAQIDAVYFRCYVGWIKTGGYGHIKHCKVFSVEKLKSLLKQN